MSKGKAVAVKKVMLPATYDYGEDAGAGFEDMDKDDFTVPFLSVLQSLSPRCEEDENARPGMLYNTVTEELFDAKEGVEFIPCHRTHRWNEWIPRDQGGGLVGSHAAEDAMIVHAKDTQQFGEYTSPAGNDLIDTYDVWGMMIRVDGTYDPVILSFTSTKIKIYKRWATQMYNLKIKQDDGRMIRPPMFAHIYRLTTTPEESPAGKYHNIRVAMSGANAAESRLSQDDERYQAAKAFRDMAVSGAAKPADDKPVPYREGGGGGDIPDDKNPDTEIPF